CMLCSRPLLLAVFFFFPHTAPTEIYTLSLHDALPILKENPCCAILRILQSSCANSRGVKYGSILSRMTIRPPSYAAFASITKPRSEEHTSELQSRFDLVCRLLLEKKKKKTTTTITSK